ncbi:sugar phosphate nucleotidyltransferase [Streptococcus sp. S784/96/1]|uniref:sugar phosphate nucleotidyltransferase n=1 Tax=Streptococcus sp. S784/96/1 TaxID=2653499 RepID=UPI001389A86E|nr:sugar phosphate nucleotidyltransferase [Streptococcus sp. S784/96/1]
MRAIILAAGMGTRLRPITLYTPKSLIKVNDETLIERQIKFLNARGIFEIYVVTGYLSEQFEFLKEKYSVNLVYNEYYDRYNNFYTMYLVKEFLSDAIVIDADNYLVENFLTSDLTTSTYFSEYKKDFQDEWLLRCDDEGHVIDIEIISGEGQIISGVSYWNEEDGALLKLALETHYDNNDFKELYWDNLVIENLSSLTIDCVELQPCSIFEIDNHDDLELLREYVSK